MAGNSGKEQRLLDFPWRRVGVLATLTLSALFGGASWAMMYWGLTSLEPHTALWIVAQEQVEAGVEMPDAGSYIDVTAPHNLVILRGAFFRELLGFVFSHRVQMSPVRMLLEDGDPEARFCRRMMGYKWLHPSQGGKDFPQVRAKVDDVRDWVSRCRREWDNLGAEEQQLLSGFRKTGEIPEDIVVKPVYDPEVTGRAARTEGAVEEYKVGRRLGDEALRRLLNESIKVSMWNGAFDGKPFERNPVIEETDFENAYAKMLDYYKSLDMRDIPKLPSDWKAVARTIREGGIATFDAVPLMPTRLFNISVEGLADMEGAAAGRSAILSNFCKPRSLRSFADMHSAVRMYTPRVVGNLADNQYITQGSHDISESAWQAMQGLSARGANPLLQHRCEVGYINNRRMKQMHSMLPDLVKEMGMEDEVLREEGYLWMGPVRGGFHFDEEANVYIQLSGESDVFLIPQSHVDMFSDGWRYRNLPSREEVLSDPWMKRVPFHLHRLKPGEGLVFPGRTFHLFLAQSYNRIAINFFFMPKWRKMEYTKYDWYSQEAAEPQGLTRLALRQLWARTFVRLYEDTGKGVIYMGEKNEYI